MAATPSTAGTAISPEMDALAREQIVQLRDALAREKTEKFQLRDALEREKLEKESLQRLLWTSMEEFDLMTTPERERAEMMDVEMQQQVEDEHDERFTFDYAVLPSSPLEYFSSDDDEALAGAEEEQGALTGYFTIGSKEHSEVVCSDNHLCPRCLRIWCKLHGDQATPGKLSYCQFKNDLRKCHGIKYNLSPKEVLDLEEVKAIQSSLCPKDRLLSVESYLNELTRQCRGVQLKKICNHLVDSDINMSLHEKSFSVTVDELRSKFRRLLPCYIWEGLITYDRFLPRFEGGQVLSQESKQKLKSMIEEYFKKEMCEWSDVFDIQEIETY